MVTDAVVDSSFIVALVTLEKYSDWVSKTLKEYEYFHILDLSFYEVANAINQKAHKGLNPKEAVLAYKQAKK
jgi:predicted nucleic acid-binding protein